MNLGAVETYRAQVKQMHFLGQFEHLHEHVHDLCEEAPPERGQGVMVGMAARRNEAKRNRVVGRAFESAAREDAAGVAVHQNPQEHGRVIRLRSASRISTRQIR